MDFEIRSDRGPQGRKTLVRERELYLSLVDQGMSNSQACRVVGVNRRTGSVWRHGRAEGRVVKSCPPARKPLVGGTSSRFLTEDERIMIADMRRAKATMRAIAAEVGRPVSTISREIKRNSHQGSGDYRPHAAQARADAWRARPKGGKIVACPELREVVQDWLGLEWGPEQISRSLRREFPDRPETRVSHETIYQALYVQGRGALTRELVACLRTGRALRVPRARSRQKAWAHVTPEVLISRRPAEADDRAVPGHWEDDLVIGLQRSAIGTLVERTTRFTMLVHLPREEGWGVDPRTKNGPALAGYGAVTMANALANTVIGLPEQLRRSLTWDRGEELSAHAQFTVQPDFTSTSSTHIPPGNAARTRIQTGCCASTSPKAPTFWAGARGVEVRGLCRSVGVGYPVLAN